ncbi:hypothetical protein RUA4292_02687 [Ruegeria atlantica]|uniref:Uncharacterized protein n=1 Tax=Ruegeria atlantica TaxID=81569 RepID=A0A0P1EET8_9RHOB|nr:hypothetical protein RUA4292_02687 [Ruegeria atlantica]
MAICQISFALVKIGLKLVQDFLNYVEPNIIKAAVPWAETSQN